MREPQIILPGSRASGADDAVWTSVTLFWSERQARGFRAFPSAEPYGFRALGTWRDGHFRVDLVVCDRERPPVPLGDPRCRMVVDPLRKALETAMGCTVSGLTIDKVQWDHREDQEGGVQ